MRARLLARVRCMTGRFYCADIRVFIVHKIGGCNTAPQDEPSMVLGEGYKIWVSYGEMK